jgi:transposase
MEDETMAVLYRVDLNRQERKELAAIVGDKRCGKQKRLRAQILLACDRGLPNATIARAIGCGESTIYRTKRRFVEEGLRASLEERQRQGGTRKLSGDEEAMLVATACSKPPAGRARWTLELLAGEILRLTDHTSISRETIRRRLKDNDLKPWQRKMWCVPRIDAEYVCRMEDVLDLYAERPNPARPVVCFDETPVQLIGEARLPVCAEPGRVERLDYEYRRNGTANLFIFLDAHRGWRHVKVTQQRTAIDFALCMRDLADVHYPQAKRIRVVMDNLSTHNAKNLYEAFAPDEARRILRRLEFHYTPKHASWLNMVEIEISVLSSQCLDRRIPDVATLKREIAAWERSRNSSGACVQWMFSVGKARAKLGEAYPGHGVSAKSRAA